MYDEKSNKGTDNFRGIELLRKAKKAFNTPERSNYQRTWSILTEFVLPSENRGWFEDPSKGIRRDRRVFDSTAIQANRDLASAMQSTITNPATDWSKIAFKDPIVKDDPEGILWCQETIEAVHAALNESNFDSQIGKGYPCYSALGSMFLFHDEDFTFTCWSLQETAIVDNDKGVVDTAYRKFNMTLKQLYDKFGDAIGEDLVEKYEKHPLQEEKVYQCIYPRDKDEVEIDKATGQGLGTKRPFASLYILDRTGRILEEDGYYEFPLYVGRWSSLPNEQYGFGPGHVAIADVRSLNKIQEFHLKGLAKAIDPPIITTKQNIISGKLTPGGRVDVRDFNSFKEFVTQSRFDVTNIKIEDLRNSIKAGFYIDKLLLPPRDQTGEMTAYEVQQRLEQMQAILGPVLSKLNVEFLSPLIMRSIAILRRKGKIKPIPASVISKLHQQADMSGKPRSRSIDIEIMYVNSLARAQKIQELRNVQQWISETAQLAQLNPGALDVLNIDALVKYGADIRDVPRHLLNDDATIQKNRDQRNSQQQMAQLSQNAESLTASAKNLGQAHQAVQPKQSSGTS